MSRELLKDILLLLIVAVVAVVITSIATRVRHMSTIREQAAQITALRDLEASLMPDHYWIQDYTIAGTQAAIYVVSFDYVFSDPAQADAFVRKIVPVGGEL